MSVRYFTDRDLGKHFPDTLAAAGLSVERFDDRFAEDTPDEVWLEYVGKNGLIAVSHDRRIRHRPNELAAVIDHHVALFVVLGKVRLAELAQGFVSNIAAVERFAAAHTPPYIAKVNRPSPSELAKNPNARGSVTLWYPTA